MYVACPSCKSLYSVTADQLRLAGGEVRCGQCQTLFNAAQGVFEDPQQALAYEPPLQQELVQEIDELVGRALGEVTAQDEALSGLADSEAIPAVAPEPLDEVFESAGRVFDEMLDESAATSSSIDNETMLSVAPESFDEVFESTAHVLCADADHYAQPVSAEFTPPRFEQETDELSGLSHVLMFHDEDSHQTRTSWGAIAALVAQYAYWDRYRLAETSALRPALEWFCAPLKCDLPLRHDLARVEMIEREVRDHPRVEDALLVSAAFVNRAPYTQAYPVLQISFSDVSGTPVAVRRFMPEEYLRKKIAANGMAPDEQTLVMLEVVDPGERAVSFQFDFM
jgi:predicted Zn finger-like uncharacterized protein